MAALLDNTARVIDLTVFSDLARQRHNPLGRRDSARGAADIELMLHALDALQQHVGVVDGSGQPRHATRSYLRLTGASQDATVVQARVRQMAEAAWDGFVSGGIGTGVHPMDECRLTTAAGEYHIRTAFILNDLFGAGPSVMVSIDPPPPDPLSRERLCDRFGLSRAQAKVAQLLGQGMRNNEIAQKLFLSPHTVRHHIEQIRRKVGGSSRTSLATRLRAADCFGA